MLVLKVHEVLFRLESSHATGTCELVSDCESGLESEQRETYLRW